MYENVIDICSFYNNNKNILICHIERDNDNYLQKKNCSRD